jgi:deazaflavin-dependent oxidoreductase (nitroreductase family)
MAGEREKGLLERKVEQAVATRGGAWFFINVAPRVDRRLLPLTNGHFSMSGRGRVGLLRVRGAKSGTERITPLVFARDGDRVLLVASRGGDVRHPAWYHNLVANPEVEWLGPGGWRRYRARTAEGPERERLWPIVVRRYSGYETYQRRAGSRVIPVVVLEPLEGGDQKSR